MTYRQSRTAQNSSSNARQHVFVSHKKQTYVCFAPRVLSGDHTSVILRDGLIRNIAYGLLVIGIMGDGVNLATGDYSVGAEGFLIEHGVITRTVNRVTIAGNFTELLGSIHLFSTT